MKKQSIKQIKTLDINGLEWFDRLNGNSYHSAKVTVNFGLKGEKTLLVPFSYGYGSMYIDNALIELAKVYEIPQDTYTDGTPKPLQLYKLANMGIIVRTSMHKALKKEVVSYGKGV